MRSETSATSAVATLSVAVAVAGHVLAGGSASLTAVPQLLALAAVAWSVGEHLTGRRWLSLGALAFIQLAAHLTLDAGHRATPARPASDQAASAAVDHAAMGHSSLHEMAGMAMPDMAMPAGAGSGHLAGVDGSQPGAAALHSGVGDALTMSAAHLLVLLVGVGLVTQTNRWVQRVVGLMARLVPQAPAAAVAVPVLRSALPGVPERPQFTQRWFTSSVSRRGPPEYGVLTALY